MMIIITLVVIAGVLGLAWARYNYKKVASITLNSCSIGLNEQDEEMVDRMSVAEIGKIIADGAEQFIESEYKACSAFILVMGLIIYVCVDKLASPYTTVAFVLGAATSMFCGGFGMKIATSSNYKTTQCARNSLGSAFRTAFRAACIIGFTLVSIAMLFLLILILIYMYLMGIEETSADPRHYEVLFQAVAGYGLGGSTVALFARVGGGIFTKAADLGSDLVGKIEAGLPEDSPKNPATIADNVGDNVGDIAGMGADLFGSFAQATCAALVIGGNSVSHTQKLFTLDNHLFVLLIPAVGIIVSIGISYILTDGPEVNQPSYIESSLKKQLIYSTIVLSIAYYFLISAFMPSFFIKSKNNSTEQFCKDWTDIYICVVGGLVSGLIIGYFTEVMTSYSYKPVRELAGSCKTGAATNVIYGLALGYLSTIVPVIVLCIICYVSHFLLGYYGVALAALGMLSNLPICLAIDSYGPISDNAGGIAEMAQLPEYVRVRTDILDAAGNTTAAVGKGFAIGSATLVGFSLYGAFLHSVYLFGNLKQDQLSFDDPMIFSCLLFGSMIPYAFSALTIKSVGKAALGMIEEVRRQIRHNPGILQGTSAPDYRACVKISTNASLKEMILPGLLVTLTPFLLGVVFGPKALLGFLPGAIVSGVQMAISASNTGGAWDNAKKYIQAGLMRDEDGNPIMKHSQPHKAAVIGDSIGDPLKDTSGPSLNILIKLMAILSLVFCEYFSSSSGEKFITSEN